MLDPRLVFSFLWFLKWVFHLFLPVLTNSMPEFNRRLFLREAIAAKKDIHLRA